MKKGTLTKIGIPSSWSSEPDEIIEAEFLGAGTFAKCFKVNSMVYSFVSMKNRNNDYSKEIIADCSTSEFLPQIEKCGYTFNGDYLVYRMPFYEKLTAKNKQAWSQAKLLQSLRTRINDDIELVSNLLPESLYDILYEIKQYCCNYGEYRFEFNRSNLATDKNGNLILLDVIFSQSALNEIRSKKEKKNKNRFDIR